MLGALLLEKAFQFKQLNGKSTKTTHVMNKATPN